MTCGIPLEDMDSAKVYKNKTKKYKLSGTQHFSGNCNLFGGSWKPNPGKRGLVKCSSSLPPLPNTWAGIAFGHAPPRAVNHLERDVGRSDPLQSRQRRKEGFHCGAKRTADVLPWRGRTNQNQGLRWSGKNPMAGFGGGMAAFVAVLALLWPLLCAAVELEMVDGARELTCSQVNSGSLWLLFDEARQVLLKADYNPVSFFSPWLCVLMVVSAIHVRYWWR